MAWFIGASCRSPFLVPGPAEVTAYVLKRHGEGAANGTINRELAVLNRMLRLAYENWKLLGLPVIRKLKEHGPRQGFFEREQFEAVRRQLPPDLQVAVSLAYTFGWRMQSEVLRLPEGGGGEGHAGRSPMRRLAQRYDQVIAAVAGGARSA